MCQIKEIDICVNHSFIYRFACSWCYIVLFLFRCNEVINSYIAWRWHGNSKEIYKWHLKYEIFCLYIWQYSTLLVKIYSAYGYNKNSKDSDFVGKACFVSISHKRIKKIQNDLFYRMH